MYAKCFYTDVLTWMTKSHAMDDSEIYDDDDDDDEVVSVCLSRQYASTDMQLGSSRDLDLRSNFDLDLSRSCYTCFDAS